MKKTLVLILIILDIGCQRAPFTSSNSSVHEDLLNRISSLIPLHTLLPAPKPGDWLYNRNEKGQTFKQYTKLDPVAPTDGKNTIYMLPIGDFDAIDTLVLRKTAAYVAAFFGVAVVLQEAISDSLIPSHSQRVHDGNPQILTKYILDSILLPNMPKDAMMYTAITAKDLYPKESWNFVFGQAYLTKKVGVSSMYRYKTPETSLKDHTQCLRRLAETSTHELTHMFSVKHCKVYRCLMNGSNSLVESDRKPMWLCPDCLLKLSWCTGYNINDRFNKLIAQDQLLHFDQASGFLSKSKRKIAE